MNISNESLIAFSKATNGEVFDHEYNGGEWMCHAVETAETIQNFVDASMNWNSCTNNKFGEIAGFKFVAFTQVQVRKGDTRKPLSIIDFGDARVVIDVDLTDF